MCDIFVGIQFIRHLQLIQIWNRSMNHLPLRKHRQAVGALQQLSAQLGKGQIRFPCDDIVSQVNDLLLFRFITDFWPPQNNEDLGSNAFQIRDQPRRFFDVPDVDAQSDDLRFVLQDLSEDVQSRLVDRKLKQPGLLLQFPHIGQQIAQSEGTMVVPGIQGRKNDRVHAYARIC